MAKSKKDLTINKEVEKAKAELENQSMENIFKLNNNQTFSKEKKPENKNGLDLWGQKH